MESINLWLKKHGDEHATPVRIELRGMANGEHAEVIAALTDHPFAPLHLVTTTNAREFAAAIIHACEIAEKLRDELLAKRTPPKGAHR